MKTPEQSPNPDSSAEINTEELTHRHPTPSEYIASLVNAILREQENA